MLHIHEKLLSPENDNFKKAINLFLFYESHCVQENQCLFLLLIVIAHQSD